ncbi:hypothetical protein FQR65_LT16003 [Abscondita terminalis]|nr:hypothetical protein FQR65_LT16003 [Abscondita terminalis]
MSISVCKEHANVEEITFTHKKSQNILRGRCINHANEYTDYNAMDKETGQLYMVKGFKVLNSNVRYIQTAIEHLSHLVELKHNNLFAIKNFIYVPQEKKMYILQEFDFGYVSLSLFLNSSVTTDAKSVGSGVAEAMNYLNKENIQRINVSHSSVYINKEGDIKLYDYGMDSLIDNTICVNNVNSSNNIFTFRVFLISLLRRKSIDTNEIENLPPDYQYLLNLCPEIQSANELMSTILPKSSETDLSLTEPKNFSVMNYKRYHSKPDESFKTMKIIGKGAFGKVYQIQDETDKKFYALKKIKFGNNENGNKIMGELTILSNLTHKHIVRYHHAWIGNDESNDSEDEDSEDESMSCLYHESDSTCSRCDRRQSDTSTKPTIDRTLFIKMEFCEGNTLAYVIDRRNLYQDSTKIWKYFKEIVKGLQHIHDENIIHRDLKPSNIFLDSNDHIKIGDFGFATNKLRYHSMEKGESQSYTTRVGTVYYKAPELNSTNSVICDNKLDMYSLGIILFEMCYHSFNTDSERANVLSNLRSKDVIFPDDFDKMSLDKQTKIIRELLNHDSKLRPSCQTLIESNLIPHFPEEKKEEKQLQVIQRFASNPESFKKLLRCCFKKENIKSPYSNIYFENITYMETTLRIVTDIFRKHGAQNYDISMVSLNDICTDNCKECIKSINEDGKVVIVPCNSRLPFLYYTILNNHYWMKRYSTQKSYHFNRPQYDCAFDIITPINLKKHKCFLPDAEILLILSQLINAFPNLCVDDFVLSINHSDLINAIIEECTVSEDPTNKEIFTIGASYLRKEKSLNNFFENYDVSALLALFDLLESEDLKKVDDFTTLPFKNLNAQTKAKVALTELTNIKRVARELGFQCAIHLQPAMCEYSEQYSGMMVQLTHKNLMKDNYIAVGGRYDNVFKNVCKDTKSKGCKRYGVGLSIFPERLNTILKTRQLLNTPEVLIYLDSNNSFSEVHKILKILWDNNILSSFVKLPTKSFFHKYSSKHKFVCAIKVKKQLLKDNKVELFYRKNYRFEKCVIGTEDLVLATRTLLLLEPVDHIVLKEGACINILYRTITNISFFEKSKYKLKINDKLNVLRSLYAEHKLLVFVIDYGIELVMDGFGEQRQLSKSVLSVCEDVISMTDDEMSIVLFLDIVSVEEDNLKFHYIIIKENCMEALKEI